MRAEDFTPLLFSVYKKTIEMTDAISIVWSWRWDLNPRPIDYESTGLNSPFDTLNIGLYNVFFGQH